MKMFIWHLVKQMQLDTSIDPNCTGYDYCREETI